MGRMTLVAYESRPAVEVEARKGESLVLGPAELEAATGWTVKPEGVCRGEVCVPVPPDAERPVVRDGGLDLEAFATLLGQPVVHDAEADAWAFGLSRPPAGAGAGPVVAPDLTLPDLDGRPRSIAEHRGMKVLLLSWASW